MVALVHADDLEWNFLEMVFALLRTYLSSGVCLMMQQRVFFKF